jgi:survival-of-motor-neuron-related-splicing factor 30
MTAQAELETYQVQLEQVELALQSDPDNSELSSLRTSLQELISLTQQSLGASAAASSSRKATVAPAASTHVWSAGDECLAKYSEDGQWYPARIISIAGSTEKRVYSVTFKGYDSTEPVDGSALKPLPAGHAASSYAAGSKRKLNKAEEEDREKKKKKNEKKVEVRAQKAKEQNSKQQTWQKFAKKSEKKGIHIAGTSGTSIFKTPDNPMGKGMSVLSTTLIRCLYWLQSVLREVARV